MNNEWRKLNAPGFGKDVIEFKQKLRERNQHRKTASIFHQAYKVRQLLRRFDSIDLDYLQEKYPEVDVQLMKDNLNEFVLQERQQRFHPLFYQRKSKL